ncbi:hypothetical protein [Micromonospora sp. SH-82]|uniref:hypothetical protein n=1 Tax=Micromonospora sp. SH-82 TaxID=3132938 RepID=UPI003EBE0695
MDAHVEQVGTTVIYQDDHVRVWILDLPPHGASEWHEHHCGYRFVVTKTGPVATEYRDGRLEPQNDQVGDTSYRQPDESHRLVNLGDGPYQNVVIEFLGSR